jgi:hypothetical protein
MTKVKENTFAKDFAQAIETRKAYEVEKNAQCESILLKLNNLRDNMTHETIAEFCAKTHLNANFINRQERKNARFNIYSADKVANIARASVKAAMLNHYTLAIIRAALALESADLIMTQRDAESACSLDLSTDKEREKLIKSCKYQRNVAANTASTQASSSINALQEYSVLIETRDTSNNRVYKLNAESEAFKALQYCIAA